MKEEQNKKSKNPDDWWYKWYVKDVETYKEVFSMEEIGKLFCAVMDYRKSSEMKTNDQPSNIRASYVSHCKAIDRMIEAYDKKCETNAKNGAKGGKAKAENAKKKKKAESTNEPNEAEPETENKFEPPKKTVFKDMVKRIAHDEGNYFLNRNLFYSDEFIDTLYTKLKQNNWSLDGEPFHTKDELEIYILNRLFEKDTEKDNDSSDYPNIRRLMIGTTSALLEMRGKTLLDYCNLDFDCFDDMVNPEVTDSFGTIKRIKDEAISMIRNYDESDREEMAEKEATQNEETPQTPEQPEPPKQSEEAKQNPYGDF